MPKVMITVKGSPSDHTHVSDDLSREDAAQQLAQAGEFVGYHGTLKLPWLVAHGQNILAVQVID